MEQKLEIRKVILANTIAFFGSNFHVQTEKKKTKTKTKNRFTETLAVRLVRIPFKPKKGHVSLHVYFKLLNVLVT